MIICCNCVQEYETIYFWFCVDKLYNLIHELFNTRHHGFGFESLDQLMGLGSNLWTNFLQMYSPTYIWRKPLCVGFFFFFLFDDKKFRYCFASKVDWSSLCHTFEFSSWSCLLSPVEDFRSILISIGSVHIRTQVTVPTRLLWVLLIRLLKSLIWFESFSHVKAGNLVTKI